MGSRFPVYNGMSMGFLSVGNSMVVDFLFLYINVTVLDIVKPSRLKTSFRQHYWLTIGLGSIVLKPRMSPARPLSYNPFVSALHLHTLVMSFVKNVKLKTTCTSVLEPMCRTQCKVSYLALDLHKHQNV